MKYDKIAIVDSVPKGEWVQLSNTGYRIPENATNMQMYVETAEDNYSFWVDEAVGAVAGTVIDGPKAEKYIKGDLNGDGVVDSFDLCRMRKAAVEGSAERFGAADINGDRTIDGTDLELLSKFLTGNIKSFE